MKTFSKDRDYVIFIELFPTVISLDRTTMILTKSYVYIGERLLVKIRSGWSLPLDRHPQQSLAKQNHTQDGGLWPVYCRSVLVYLSRVVQIYLFIFQRT